MRALHIFQNEKFRDVFQHGQNTFGESSKNCT